MQGGLHLLLQQFVFLSLGREVVCKDHWLKGSNTRTHTHGQATRCVSAVLEVVGGRSNAQRNTATDTHARRRCEGNSALRLSKIRRVKETGVCLLFHHVILVLSSQNDENCLKTVLLTLAPDLDQVVKGFHLRT